MHAFENIALKSTEDLERGFFFLSLRLETLNESEMQLLEKITQELVRKLNTELFTGNLPTKGEYFQVKLYSTVVYDEWPDKITLRTGGWNTPTTASRIHQALRHRGHMNNVNIKNGLMHCDGKPFVNREYVIVKGSSVGYQLKTGQVCSCKPGIGRDNCPQCEGTGMRIDFAKIRGGK